MIMRQRVWLKHYKREDWEQCPLCGERLKWVYDGIYWIPCDIKPLLFKWDLDGKFAIVKQRELIEGCEIYKGGDTEGYTMGLMPHVYSCWKRNGWRGVKYET